MEYSSINLLHVKESNDVEPTVAIAPLAKPEPTITSSSTVSLPYYELVSSSSRKTSTSSSTPPPPTSSASPHRLVFSPDDQINLSTENLTESIKTKDKSRKHSSIGSVSTAASDGASLSIDCGLSNHSAGSQLKVAHHVPGTFSSPQSTSQLRRTAFLVTLFSFVIGTGCLPLGISAMVLICRKKGSRSDYKNALIIATMACIVGLAVNALCITYVILKLQRQALQEQGI